MALRAGHIRIGPERGPLLVRTSRQGLAATAGHDLTIEVTSWSADVTVTDTGGTITGVLTIKGTPSRASTNRSLWRSARPGRATTGRPARWC